MFELHFDTKVEILQGTVNFPEGENTGWPRIVFLFTSSHFGGKEQKLAEASSNGGKFIWNRTKQNKTLSEDNIQKMSRVKVVFLYFSVCLSLMVLSD